MKKIMLSLLLLMALGTKVKAQVVDTVTYTYWYYPAQNIYYSDATNEYWYYDTSTQQWIDASTLPTTYVVADTDTRYRVKMKGSKLIWKDNANHKVKYKIKKNGQIKRKH